MPRRYQKASSSASRASREEDIKIGSGQSCTTTHHDHNTPTSSCYHEFMPAPSMHARASFLSLPLEIREVIYKSVLDPDEQYLVTSDTNTTVKRKYDVRMLRTCKQVYFEAKKVFQRRHQYVKITSPWPESADRARALADISILCQDVAASRFRLWIMDVTIVESGKSRTPAPSPFVIDMRDLPKFCREWYDKLVTPLQPEKELTEVYRYYDGISMPSINADFKLRLVMAGVPGAPEVALPTKVQNQLLEPWKSIRQPARVEIDGPHAEKLATDLANTMEMPYPDASDCLDRCAEARDVGNDAFTTGNCLEALQYYKTGLEAIHISADDEIIKVRAKGFFGTGICKGRHQGVPGVRVYRILRFQLISSLVMAYIVIGQILMAEVWARHSYAMDQFLHSRAPFAAKFKGAAWSALYSQAKIAGGMLDDSPGAHMLSVFLNEYSAPLRVLLPEYDRRKLAT